MKTLCMLADGSSVEREVGDVYAEAVSITRREFRVKKSDITWTKTLFSTGIKAWVTDPALYILDHERKVLKVDAVNLSMSMNPFVDIARVEKVSRQCGWKMEW